MRPVIRAPQAGLARAVTCLARDVRERGDALAAQAEQMREAADLAVWEGREGAEFLASLRVKARRCGVAAADLRRAADYLDTHAAMLQASRSSRSRSSVTT